MAQCCSRFRFSIFATRHYYIHTLTQLAVSSYVLSLSSWNLHCISVWNVRLGWCRRRGYSVASSRATRSVSLLFRHTSYKLHVSSELHDKLVGKFGFDEIWCTYSALNFPSTLHFETCQCCRHMHVNTLLLMSPCMILCFFTICLLQQTVQKMHEKTSHYSDANVIHSCILVLVTSQEDGQCNFRKKV